jgi:3-hydroxymyristoyl/3-hydroxydecanoyl-(acyl carrier protein) dehydratase
MHPDAIEPLARTGRRRPLYQPEATHAVDLGRAAVERLLPHRDPFLFIDRITAVDLPGLAIAGQRRIDPADPLFAGHFPADPIYPGVLQLETLGQLGLCLFTLARNGRSNVGTEDQPRPARAIKIHHATFLAPVRPGDELAVLARVLESDDYTGIAAGQICRGETICCFGIMEVYFVET